MMVKAQSDNDKQVSRFKETARLLGCDEDEAAFDEKLGKIARHKPEPDASETSNGKK